MQIGVWYSNNTLAMNSTSLDLNTSETLANKTLIVTTILVRPSPDMMALWLWRLRISNQIYSIIVVNYRDFGLATSFADSNVTNKCSRNENKVQWF